MEERNCGASSSRAGSEAARGRTGLTSIVRRAPQFSVGMPMLQRLQMLPGVGGKHADYNLHVVIAMSAVPGIHLGRRWPGSRASDGRPPPVPACLSAPVPRERRVRRARPLALRIL